MSPFYIAAYVRIKVLLLSNCKKVVKKHSYIFKLANYSILINLQGIGINTVTVIIMKNSSVYSHYIIMQSTFQTDGHIYVCS